MTRHPPSRGTSGGCARGPAADVAAAFASVEPAVSVAAPAVARGRPGAVENACTISQTPTHAAAASTATNAGFHRNSEPTTMPASSTPTPIAAGRLRPARLEPLAGCEAPPDPLADAAGSSPRP